MPWPRNALTPLSWSVSQCLEWCSSTSRRVQKLAWWWTPTTASHLAGGRWLYTDGFTNVCEKSVLLRMRGYTFAHAHVLLTHIPLTWQVDWGHWNPKVRTRTTSKPLYRNILSQVDPRWELDTKHYNNNTEHYSKAGMKTIHDLYSTNNLTNKLNEESKLNLVSK